MGVTAIIGAGLLGAGGAVAAGAVGSSAAENAAATTAEAQIYATQQEREMFEEQMALYREMQSLLEPFIRAGRGVLPTMEQIASGVGSVSPLYKMQEKEGIKAVREAYAARGKLGSPEAMKAETDFTKALAAEEGARQWGYLTGLAGVGLSAAGTSSQGTMGAMSAAGNTGSTLAQLYANLGAARAGYESRAGSAWASALGDIGSIGMGAIGGYTNYLMWNQLMNSVSPTVTGGFGGSS